MYRVDAVVKAVAIGSYALCLPADDAAMPIVSAILNEFVGGTVTGLLSQEKPRYGARRFFPEGV